MCRNEAPVNFGIRAVGKLAQYLRDQRNGAGFSNVQLAELLDVDPVTIRRAASGSIVPKRPLVEAWTGACGGDTDRAVHAWRQARYQFRRVTLGRPVTALPNPDLITTRQMLSDALVELYERAGAPAFREMERRGGDFGVLPHNTARRIAQRQTLPVSDAQFRAFLRACEVPRPNAWMEARDRVDHLYNVSSGGIATWRFDLQPKLESVRSFRIKGVSLTTVRTATTTTARVGATAAG